MTDDIRPSAIGAPARVTEEEQHFDDWASHIVSEMRSKSDSQIEWEIVEALRKAHRVGLARVQALEAEVEKQRIRAITAEQHKVMSLLGKSSWQEVVEDKLRTELAETQLRAEAAEAQVQELERTIAYQGQEVSKRGLRIEELEREVAELKKEASQIADACVQQVAELPDRTSPEDWPEAMLVTADELRGIVREAVCQSNRKAT